MKTPKIPNYIFVISNQNKISLHPEIIYTPNQPQLNSKKYQPKESSIKSRI
jgi:hypothetical protein